MIPATTKRCENDDHSPETQRTLEDGAPFNLLSLQARQRLRSEKSMQSLPKGRMIFAHEDPASRFFFVESGWVKLFRQTFGGDEAILDVLPPGSVFGHTAFCEGHIYNHGAETIEECRIISYPLAVLEAETKTNPEFTVAFLQHVAARGLTKDKEIELRSVQNAAQRIGCFILRLCKDHDNNRATLCLPWEKSLIAIRLGMAPETFSRGLARLQKDTGIMVEGSVIEITDVKSLAQYTCMACSSVFPCKN